MGWRVVGEFSLLAELVFFLVFCVSSCQKEKDGKSMRKGLALGFLLFFVVWFLYRVADSAVDAACSGLRDQMCVGGRCYGERILGALWVVREMIFVELFSFLSFLSEKAIAKN